MKSLQGRYGEEHPTRNTNQNTCWLSLAAQQEKTEGMQMNTLVKKKQKKHTHFFFKIKR